MLSRKKKMSELYEGFTVYPQVPENVRVKDKAAAQSDIDVRNAVAQVSEQLGETGRILVRESGTEPVIRVMVEAESEETCRKYVNDVIKVVKDKGHAFNAECHGTRKMRILCPIENKVSQVANQVISDIKERTDAQKSARSVCR